ncbi:MAG: DUF4417 domain-containing protein [Fibrobacteraceae bacterium]|nr:DUF4417 domain-containing protein [Fibrobacteraceae bacterium]MCF0217351.1 DUF4417 domain-containing protein [Fibrobacteraceae bacterium]
MKSKTFRTQPLFLRNTYPGAGRWQIPLIKKQPIDLNNLNVLSYNNICNGSKPLFHSFGIHFFVDDYRFESVYSNPEKSYKKLKPHRILFTPDFSQYCEMQPWRRIESVGKGRWCGAYWQDQGSTVIATVSWSTPESFDYAFDGIQQGAVVAIGMIGCKSSKVNFLKGFWTMCERIEPECIICFGTPFPEMLTENLLVIDYVSTWRVA